MAFRNWKQELEDFRPPGPSPWPIVLRCGLATLMLASAACGALWVWPGFLLPKPWVRPGPPPAAVTLIFSSDLRGNLEPCGCTSQRWGGVARMAGAIGRIARPGTNKPAANVLVEVGNMGKGPLTWQRLGLEHYLAALGKMKCAAANLGPAEATLSAAGIKELAGRSSVPLVSANLLEAGTLKPLVAPYRQLLVDNLRITLVGVTGGDPECPPGQGVQIGDINDCLGKLLPELRGQTDLVVLLACCDELTLRAIAQAHPELDVVLGGHVAQATKAVEVIGACRLAWHANKGQTLGRMDVMIRPDGRPGEATSAVFVLDNDVPEDASLLDVAERYNAELSAIDRQSGLAGLGVSVGAVPAGGNVYAGARSCRACHAKTFATWAASRHAAAFASLTGESPRTTSASASRPAPPRRRDSNPDCVSCHVVDLGAGDGFRGILVTPDLAGVGCECCHGRCSEHVNARQRGAPAAIGKLTKCLPNSCNTCHDCLHSPEFTYETYWEKIKHGLDKDK